MWSKWKKFQSKTFRKYSFNFHKKMIKEHTVKVIALHINSICMRGHQFFGFTAKSGCVLDKIEKRFVFVNIKN